MRPGARADGMFPAFDLDSPIVRVCVFFFFAGGEGGAGSFSLSLSLFSDSLSVHFFSLTLSLSLWRSVSVVGFYLCVLGWTLLL